MEMLWAGEMQPGQGAGGWEGLGEEELLRGSGRAGPLVSEASPGSKGVLHSPQALPTLPPLGVIAGAILRLPAAFQLRREIGFLTPNAKHWLQVSFCFLTPIDHSLLFKLPMTIPRIKGSWGWSP